jgi:hypothetical protein
MKSNTRDEAENKMHQAEGTVAEDVREPGFVHCNQEALDLLGMTREELLVANTAGLSQKRQPDGRLSREKAEELITHWCFFGKPA